MKCCPTISNSFPYIQQAFVFHVQISFVLFITILLLFFCLLQKDFWYLSRSVAENLPKYWLYFPKIKATKKNFHVRLKQTNHLAHPMNFLYLPKRKQFLKQKHFSNCLEKPILHPKKKCRILTRETLLFLSKKTFLIINVKNNFRDKNFLMKKTCFVSDAFWIQLCYFHVSKTSATVKILKVSKWNLRGFSHTVRETKPLVVFHTGKTIDSFNLKKDFWVLSYSPQNKTFLGFPKSKPFMV